MSCHIASSFHNRWHRFAGILFLPFLLAKLEKNLHSNCFDSKQLSFSKLVTPKFEASVVVKQLRLGSGRGRTDSIKTTQCALICPMHTQKGPFLHFWNSFNRSLYLPNPIGALCRYWIFQLKKLKSFDKTRFIKQLLFGTHSSLRENAVHEEYNGIPRTDACFFNTARCFGTQNGMD